MPVPQGVCSVVETQAPPLTPPPPPPRTKGTITGENEICNWENLIGPLLVHKVVGPKPPPALLSPGQQTPCRAPPSYYKELRFVVTGIVSFSHSPATQGQRN